MHKGVPLNSQERALIRQMRGTTAAEMLPQLMTSPAYRAATDEGKRSLVSNVYKQINSASADSYAKMSPDLQARMEKRRIYLNQQTP